MCCIEVHVLSSLLLSGGSSTASAFGTKPTEHRNIKFYSNVSTKFVLRLLCNVVWNSQSVKLHLIFKPLDIMHLRFNLKLTSLV